MKTRWPTALFCLLVVALLAWMGSAGSGGKKTDEVWKEISPGIWRTTSFPAGYALLDGDEALLIDAPPAARVKPPGVKKIAAVLVTHHHRDLCAAVSQFLAEKIKVVAPKAAAEWLTPQNVRKYWKESLPLRNSRTAYLVVPEGLDGIDCRLEDGDRVTWHGWTIDVVATPGHSRLTNT
jgi:glyoxylase-like metal-dependent hydrolase (beta-lactamase superfamily II)